jgi:hypothetical protein
VAGFENRDLGVYTSTLVRHGMPVTLVLHDAEGDWQFLSSTENDPEQCVHTHLSHLVAGDPTLHALADLPLGWKAWRESAGEPWQREPIPADQGEL